METAVPINYLAVLACGVATMIIGFLWYGPVFGKMWMQLMGWGPMNPEQLAAKQKQARTGYIVMFISSLVMAYVLAHAITFGSAYLQITGIAAGLQGAFWSWLGFIATVTLGSVLWEGRSWKLWVLNAGYYLVVLIVMGIILVTWPA
jgi:hypothetical protein